MKTGDERYLPPRDKGPVRRFIRDFVDSRFSFIELMVPLLIVTMILGYSGNAYLAGVGNTILLGTLLLVVVDMTMLRFRLRRELTRRFPDEPLKGTTYYAVMRALQMKFMRHAQGAGQDRPEAPRALPLNQRTGPVRLAREAGHMTTDPLLILSGAGLPASIWDGVRSLLDTESRVVPSTRARRHARLLRAGSPRHG